MWGKGRGSKLIQIVQVLALSLGDVDGWVGSSCHSTLYFGHLKKNINLDMVALPTLLRFYSNQGPKNSDSNTTLCVLDVENGRFEKLKLCGPEKS